ncbi:MAG: hypothetical protein GY835_28400 [bacterium]|nr:hypothetical protein [bacterium]
MAFAAWRQRSYPSPMLEFATPRRMIVTAIAVVVSLSLVVPRANSAEEQTSANFTIKRLVPNQGSGFRVGLTYQIIRDTISDQPVGTTSSSSLSLTGKPLVTAPADSPSCGIFVNGVAERTNTELVELGLVCGHATGCTEVEISNNGVAWEGPFPFSTSRSWTLPSIEGDRTVFARFRNGLGNLSGVCHDSITLDTRAPTVGISPAGGTYMATQEVALTASEPGTVFYTTDGSDPITSPTALEYTRSINVTDDGTIRAYAVDVSGNVGSVVEETYQICLGNNLSIYGSVTDATIDLDLPLAVVTLDSGDSDATDLEGSYAINGLDRGWYAIQSVTTPTPGYVSYQSEILLCEGSVNHDIVLTRAGTIYGLDNNSGFSSEGVNTSTGNFSYKVMDLALPGIGPSFVFERTYNSQDATDGPLGYGWTWGFNITLSEFPDSERVLRWGDGKTEVWKRDGGGGWTPMYGVFSTLVENPDSTFTLRTKDLLEYNFDLSDRLSTIVDEYGNAITFHYTGDDLTSVLDTAGRTIAFSHDASGRITNMLDPMGQSVSFIYDANGDLVTAVNMEGKPTTYTYDGAHRMLTLTDPRGNVAITNIYDEGRGTVVIQRDALGDETRYLYDVPNKVTTVIDAEGNIYAHHFDDLLRLIQEDDPRGFSSFRTYNERGSLESVTDNNGNVTTFTYDANGNVLTKSEPLGRVSSATYDAANNPVSKTDPRGHLQLFEYDPVNSNLLASYACGAVPEAACTSDPTVAVTTYGYNPVTGQLLSVTEATGTPLERTTTYEYDVQGNRTAVTNALGKRSTFTYDSVGRKLTESHPLGRATAYEYDVMDRLLAVIDALGGVTLFGYDANGNKTDHWDANGKHTTFVFDTKNRLIAKIDALGNTVTYCYDGADRPKSISNARGATVSVVYDADSNVIQEADALGNVSRYEYDGNKNRTVAINAKGARKGLVYNELGLLVEVVDPLGANETYEYDANGNQTRATNALGQSTISVYDAFNRLLTVTDPEGNTIANSYDLLGRLIAVEDARGHRTVYEYDLLDRMARVVDDAGGVVSLAYDALGNQVSVTGPRLGISAFAYDVLGRLVITTDPLSNNVVRAYDAVGNLTSIIDSFGTTSFAYDSVGRVTQVIQPDLTTIQYTYDQAGNRTIVSDSTGTTVTSYDLADQVVSVTDPFGNTVHYTYDPNGNRSSIRYPGFRLVSFLFDEKDRVREVRDWAGVTTSYAYDSAGRLTIKTLGNGATVFYGYDASGRLVSKTDRLASGQVLASYALGLDGNGNRTGLSFTQPLLPSIGAADVSFSHNQGDQVTGSNGWSYAYDSRGNRVSATDGISNIEYQYDSAGLLTGVVAEAGAWEFRYTSTGQRIASVRDGVFSRHLLDQVANMALVIADLDENNILRTSYVYGDGLLYSVNEETGERLFHHYDLLGNTVALTDLQGHLEATYAYLPYGGQQEGDNTRHTRFTFGGRYGVSHEGLGLFYMRSRYYDSGTRSFLSIDPKAASVGDHARLNRYAFARSNPIVNVDPEGTEDRDAVAAHAEFFIELGVDHALQKFFPWFRKVSPWLTVGFEVYDGYHAFNEAASAAETQCFWFEPGCHIGSYAGSVKHAAANFWDSVKTTPTGPIVGSNPVSDAKEYVQNAFVEMSMFGAPDGSDGGVLEPMATPIDPWRRTTYADGTPYPSAEYIQYKRRLRIFNGDTDALARWTARQSLPPRRTRYLDVSGYAKARFHDEYRNILMDGYLDQRTRSYVEHRIAAEIAILSQSRYKYTEGNDSKKRRAKERRAHDVTRSIESLYGSLLATLSKHRALILDLSSLPAGAEGGIARTGVYAGGG